MIEARPLAIPEIMEIRLAKHPDARGFFSEVYNSRDWQRAGIGARFMQDNHSFSAEAGTLRGLHYQLPPHAQDKLIRVARGQIFDVAVDIRRGSPSLGKWVGTRLSAADWNQLYVPAGFAHGFVTLVPETEVIYKVSAHYDAAAERTIRFDDPDIGIDWPISPQWLSDKDRAAQSLARAELFEMAAL